MKIVIATDSFKGSGSSQAIGTAIKQGILQVAPTTQVVVMPVADGGEGTLASLVTAHHGHYQTSQVTGALGAPVTAKFGVYDRTAVIEVAAAVGLPSVHGHEDPLRASSYGVGELIHCALDTGAHRILIGLGGSATNDGGLGMAQALGAHFYTKTKEEVAPGLNGLDQVVQLDLTQLDPRLRQTELVGLTDVQNPLTGTQGATYVYGQQKGLTQAQLPSSDIIMQRYAQLVQARTGINAVSSPGTGAAGGLGFGLVTLLKAKLVAGAPYILQQIGLAEQIAAADLVVTGEGRLDKQSLNGKLPAEVAKIAKKAGKSVVAVVGSRSLALTSTPNIDLVLPLVNEPLSLAAATEKTFTLARLAGINVMQAWRLGQS